MSSIADSFCDEGTNNVQGVLLMVETVFEQCKKSGMYDTRVVLAGAQLLRHWMDTSMQFLLPLHKY